MERRKDDAGKIWTLDKVDRAVIAIVAKLAGRRPRTVTRATSFGPTGLKWDKLGKLAVIKPIHRRLHERLEDGVVVVHVSRVGQLCDYVWSRMEAAQ